MNAYFTAGQGATLLRDDMTTLPDDMKAFVSRNNAPISREPISTGTRSMIMTLIDDLRLFFENHSRDHNFFVEMILIAEDDTSASENIEEYVVAYRFHGDTVIMFPMYISETYRASPNHERLSAALFRKLGLVEPQAVHVCGGMRIEPNQTITMTDDQLYWLWYYITTAILNDSDYVVDKRDYAPLPSTRMTVETRRVVSRKNLFGQPVRTGIAVNVHCNGLPIAGVAGYVDYVKADTCSDSYYPMFIITDFNTRGQTLTLPLLLLGLCAATTLSQDGRWSTFVPPHKLTGTLHPLIIALDMEQDNELYWATSVFNGVAQGNLAANAELLKAISALAGGKDPGMILDVPSFHDQRQLVSLGSYKDQHGAEKDIREIDRCIAASLGQDDLLQQWDDTTSNKVQRDRLVNCITPSAQQDHRFANRLIVHPVFLHLLSHALTGNGVSFITD